VLKECNAAASGAGPLLLLRVPATAHVGVLLKGPIIAMLWGCNNFASLS